MVSEAARAAGIGRRTAYSRRERDENFQTAWDETIEVAVERLEQEAVRRALDGSDQLLMFLLRARRPEKYVERHQVRHAGAHGGPLPPARVALNGDERQALAAMLRARPARRADG